MRAGAARDGDAGTIDSDRSYFTARGTTNAARLACGLSLGVALSILAGWLTSGMG